MPDPCIWDKRTRTHTLRVPCDERRCPPGLVIRDENLLAFLDVSDGSEAAMRKRTTRRILPLCSGSRCTNSRINKEDNQPLHKGARTYDSDCALKVAEYVTGDASSWLNADPNAFVLKIPTIEPASTERSSVVSEPSST
ncbi:hypothetical protein Hypma_001520 [Hypsizygus marmoreus]|uniref:Uncharacterized protein n=1 Tax=Hypsizygus marmoreus TaxID=39966 RepID=A0A369K4A9_HYPMA|nr:hypothetical protein Hypma_001520 [Hypsizygus marmoreus]